MPSLLTHLDIADRCIKASGLNTRPWFDYSSFLSGSLIPDLGYYNNKELAFTLISHSRKNKKIIKDLLKNAGKAEEISLSLGFLSHIIADNILERFIDRQALKIKNLPWYILKTPRSYKSLLKDLHHMRIEWSMELNILDTNRGDRFLHKKICLPGWQTRHNLITYTYKRLFDLNINYQNLVSSLEAINQLKTPIQKLVSLAGLKSITYKKFYPFEKLRYHLLRNLLLLISNLHPRSIYAWAILDPQKLNIKQRQTFDKLKNKVVRRFTRYIKFHSVFKTRLKPRLRPVQVG